MTPRKPGIDMTIMRLQQHATGIWRHLRESLKAVAEEAIAYKARKPFDQVDPVDRINTLQSIAPMYAEAVERAERALEQEQRRERAERGSMRIEKQVRVIVQNDEETWRVWRGKRLIGVFSEHYINTERGEGRMEYLMEELDGKLLSGLPGFPTVGAICRFIIKEVFGPEAVPKSCWKKEKKCSRMSF